MNIKSVYLRLPNSYHHDYLYPQPPGHFLMFSICVFDRLDSSISDISYSKISFGILNVSRIEKKMNYGFGKIINFLGEEVCSETDFY